MQERFCRYVAQNGYSIVEAVKAAGYAPAGNGSYSHVASRLANNNAIASRIQQLREELYDPEVIKRELIRTDLLAHNFNITDYVEVVEDIREDGTPYMRKRLVKPIREWDAFALSNVCGYDKTGIPVFRDKVDASKELKRVHGFYKDNIVTLQQDTFNVLAGAGLTPSVGDDSMSDVNNDYDDFDGDAFDNALKLEVEDNDFNKVKKLMRDSGYPM